MGRVQVFTICFLVSSSLVEPLRKVLLASQVAALMESKPPVTLPKNGQLDPFSVAPSSRNVVVLPGVC